jgi:hypothetical protein
LLSDFSALRVDGVSHPSDEDFASFLYDYRDFQSDCVSRDVPDYFGQWVTLERRADDRFAPNSLSQTALAVVVRMALMPLRTRSAMSRLLALFAAAAPLTLARSPARLEPLAALTARALATHCCLLEGLQRRSSQQPGVAADAANRCLRGGLGGRGSPVTALSASVDA